MSGGRGQRMAGGVATNLLEMPTCPLWHHKGIISRTFLKADASEDIKLRRTFLISGDVCWKKIGLNEFCEIWDLYCSDPGSLQRTRLQNQKFVKDTWRVHPLVFPSRDGCQLWLTRAAALTPLPSEASARASGQTDLQCFPISSNHMACSRGGSGTTDVHVDLPVMSTTTTTTTKRPEERWRGRPGESLRLISIYLRGNTIYTDIIQNWHSFLKKKNNKQIMFYFSPEWLIYKCIL